jgi:mRNA interferase MazF
VKQGDVWWGEQPHEKPRPFIVLTRDEAIPVLHSVLVAPLTRRERRTPTEMKLDVDDGVLVDSWATFDNVKTIRKVYLTRWIGELSAGRWHEVCAAMRAAIDC